MGSLEEKGAEDTFLREDSHFPPGRKAAKAGSNVGVIPISVPKPNFSGGDADHGLWIRSIHAAWALLLRAYLSRDVVSFASITISRQSVEITQPIGTTSVNVIEAFLYRYGSIGQYQRGGCAPNQVRSLTPQDVENGLVNTAIILDSSDPSLAGDVRRLSPGYKYKGHLYEVSYFENGLRITVGGFSAQASPTPSY